MHNFLHGLRFLLSGTREIYAHSMIRTFSLSLTGVFVPIYLLSLSNSLEFVGLFYLILYIWFALFSMGALAFERILGSLERMIFFGVLLYAVFLFSLAFPVLPLLFSAVIAGASLGLYWNALNADFSISISRGQGGKATGSWNSLSALAGLFAPVIGALFVDVIGFSLSLALSGVLLLFSLLPFLLSQRLFVREGCRVSEIIRGELSLEFFLQGIILAVMLLWPIHLFLIDGELLFVGALSTLAGFALALFHYAYGNFSDRFSRLTLLRVGGLLLGLMWVAAALFQDIFSVSVLSFLMGFAAHVVWTPLFAFFSEFAKQDPLAWMSVREVSLCSARLLVFTLLIVTASFTSLFVFAALASFAFMLVRPVHMR